MKCTASHLSITSKLQQPSTSHGIAKATQWGIPVAAVAVEVVAPWWSTKASLSSVPSAAKVAAPTALDVGRDSVGWALARRREYTGAVRSALRDVRRRS